MSDMMDVTAAAVTCVEIAQDWTCHQPIMEPEEAHQTLPSLLNDWLLIDSAEGTVVVFSCLPTGEPMRHQWIV